MIESTKNDMVKLFKALSTAKERKRTGLICIEGPKMVEDALQAGWEFELCLYDPRWEQLALRLIQAGVKAFPAGEAALCAAAQTQTPQGILCTVRMQEPTGFGGLVLALDGVQDPGNVGTMIRTADAAGFGGVLLGTGTADPFSPKVVRATMGSVFRMPVQMTMDMAGTLNEMKSEGYVVSASALDGENFFTRSADAEKAVLVVGSEGDGVSPSVLSVADRILCLPMAGGAESLNAAVAAGIMMYDWMRRANP